MGLDEPGPGSAAFHLKFSESLQVMGTGVLSGLKPAPFGPRNRDQSPAWQKAPSDIAKTVVKHIVRAEGDHNAKGGSIFLDGPVEESNRGIVAQERAFKRTVNVQIRNSGGKQSGDKEEADEGKASVVEHMVYYPHQKRGFCRQA